jgi:hypothetical protein
MQINLLPLLSNYLFYKTSQNSDKPQFIIIKRTFEVLEGKKISLSHKFWKYSCILQKAVYKSKSQMLTSKLRVGGGVVSR